MIKRKPNGKYQVVVHLGYDEQGKRIQKTKTVDSEKEAKLTEAKLILEGKNLFEEIQARRAAENGRVTKKPEDMTVGEYVQQWYEAMERNIRKNTQKTYKLKITQLKATGIMDIPLTNVTPPLVQKAMMQLPSHLSASTRKEACGLLRRIFNQAVEWDMLVKNPFRGVKLPKVERKEPLFWTEKEVAVFLTAAQERKNYVFFALLIATGLRIGEAIALQWADLDFSKGCVSIAKTCIAVKAGIPEFGPPKTPGSKRVVFLDPDIMSLLKVHRAVQVETRLRVKSWLEQDLMFCNNKGKAISYGSYWKQLERLCKKAKITVVHPHSIRHTHATILLSQGVPIQIIADRLGHSPGKATTGAFAMTAHYSHITDKERKEASLVYAKAIREALLDYTGKYVLDGQR